MLNSNHSERKEASIELCTIKSSDDGFPIPIKVWTPPGPPPRAAVFFIHGGKFAEGDRESHSSVSLGLASLHFAVITATFRNGTDAPNSTGRTMRDLADVIGYFKKRHPAVPFGLIGSSSGGYFALSLCQILDKGAVDFCCVICPVASPGKRASYLRSCIAETARGDGYVVQHNKETAQSILDTQMGFWETDDAMEKAGEALRTNKHNIPTLLILGSVDKNAPLQVTSDVRAWATKTVIIGGAGHGINDVLPTEYQSYLPDIDELVKHIENLKTG